MTKNWKSTTAHLHTDVKRPSAIGQRGPTTGEVEQARAVFKANAPFRSVAESQRVFADICFRESIQLSEELASLIGRMSTAYPFMLLIPAVAWQLAALLYVADESPERIEASLDLVRSRVEELQHSRGGGEGLPTAQ